MWSSGRSVVERSVKNLSDRKSQLMAGVVPEQVLETIGKTVKCIRSEYSTLRPK